MRNTSTEPELSRLLERYDAAGGVLDYIFFAAQGIEPAHTLHRAAALVGMVEIDRRLEQWATRTACEEYPIEMFYRVRWDEAKLTGERISFSSFWGTDDVEPKPIGNRAWSIPNVDGYKTAFFHPPYSLRGLASENAQLFADLNRHVLGTDPESAEIYSWSTDWSNYFDAGHEWWGAFYWTIRPAGSQRMVVVGASTTD